MSVVTLPSHIESRTVPALLETRAAAVGSRTALVALSGAAGGERTLTYAEVYEQAGRIATALAAQGVAKGDRVGILLSNEAALEAHVTYHATHRLGAINVPLNTLLTSRELARAIEFAAPKVIVAASASLLASSELRDVTTGCTIVALDEPGNPFRESDALDPASQVELDEEDDADWIFTSGTTGSPKAVALTHASSVACGYQSLNGFGLDQDSVYQSSAPFFTSTGCHANLLGTLAAGAVYVVEPAFHWRETLERIARYRTTSIFLMSGALLLSLERLGEAGLRELDLSSLKRLCYGGQAMMPSFYRHVDRVFRRERRLELVHLIGLTEGGPSGVMLTPELHEEAVRRCGTHGLSVGRQGLNEWIDFEVVDEEDRPVKANEVGELCLRGPAVMRGYVNDSEATKSALRRGWLHTGDMVIQEEDGLLYFVDRKKQMIRRGGLNVASAEVEAVLLEHPKIAEAAVLPRPNRILGEEVAAVVVATDSTLEDKDVIAHCAERLAPYKVPVEVVFRDSLPRNAMGRVVKAELR